MFFSPPLSLEFLFLAVLGKDRRSPLLRAAIAAEAMARCILRFSSHYSRLQASLLQIRKNVMSTIMILYRPWKWMRLYMFFFPQISVAGRAKRTEHDFVKKMVCEVLSVKFINLYQLALVATVQYWKRTYNMNLN